MSVFQCENCGCVENTALAVQGFKGWPEKSFDWSYAPERKGKLLCSACGPVKTRSGQATEFGEWHDEFERTFLPLGQFKTNSRGNLEHIESGDTDYRKFAIEQEAAQ
ncbi:hypothetical protein [Pontibacterium sp.]|uniref:hypothetical protein n=1 Tax=Pontibacterium sp. TaxID=2036026 RepID=UPI00356A5FCE